MCSETLATPREAFCARSLKDAGQTHSTLGARQIIDSNRNTPLTLQDIAAYLDQCNTP